MIINLLLQTPPESFTRLQQTAGLIVVNVGSVAATFIFVLKTLQDLKKTAKDTKKTAQELLSSKDEIVNSKDEIVEATKRNYQAIKENTSVTQQQAVEIQKHIVERVRRELVVLSQRIAHIEMKLSTEEDGTTPTTAWEKEGE
jgi:hypothetical protein